MSINWGLKETVEAKRLRKLEADYQLWKLDREKAVSLITVTVKGLVYDGDETSQNRMARAVAAVDSLSATVNWTMADNSVVLVTAGDLKEALRLAGIRQTEIWNEGRPVL